MARTPWKMLELLKNSLVYKNVYCTKSNIINYKTV